MKKILIPVLVSFTTLGLATACNSSTNNAVENSKNTDITAELNIESKKVIEEYNSLILEFQNSDDEKKTTQKLKSLIPRLEQINSDKERNRILINTYLRIGEIDRAYEFIEEILSKDKRPNLKNFQCMLMESLNKSPSLIQDCYLAAASLYKNKLDKLDPSEAMYTKILWGYNVNMLHAGNREYINQLKKIVNDQKSEQDKMMYESLFELETNIEQRQQLLTTIASSI
ncbi:MULTISPECIES: hypothetical protein [Acinetobacter]|uniref:Tetratricopeptide repeat protein n=1 Tax=Acinetobacter indicus TaxID=756892 RepID=A0A6C0Y430_9GAMM|nr:MULTISPECIES: hypothetical protein [Acinetobacter]MDM1771159.1 hypothetical protein [Acinetobacter indicus]MDM1773958.1 hypothetical protein [Acinetobacter indicus]QFS16705.1 hypothetical protein FHP22_03775 [Acinetobacter indicus]QIC70923.1 hypothetical protein FSC09_11130 [Acinetobacter indicus]QIC78282.1 hypothetical protein FSC02_03680 [Acinetobacter indicus]